VNDFERAQYWWRRALAAEEKLKPRKVTTEKELDELPSGTVIQTDSGKTIFRKYSNGMWYMTAMACPFFSAGLAPATLIIQPDTKEIPW
jgi:hypothetical protein